MKQAERNRPGPIPARNRPVTELSVVIADDHRNGGRNENAERAPRSNQPQHERPGIAALRHLADRDRADRRGGGNGGTGDRGEDRAGQDRGNAQTARPVTDPALHRTVKRRPMPADEKDVAHQQEKRHGKELERVDAREHELACHDQRQPLQPEHGDTKSAQREGDRHPEKQQRHENGEDYQRLHRVSRPFLPDAARAKASSVRRSTGGRAVRGQRGVPVEWSTWATTGQCRSLCQA